MNKTIIINNQKDYNKLLRRIKYYKYYPFTKFIIKNNINNPNITIISNYLNIKNRTKKIKYIYKEAIKYINNYYTQDLCQFKNNQCFIQRRNKSNKRFGCCQDCKLVKENLGCTTNNFSCKLVYCKPAIKNITLLKIKDIDILRCYSLIQRFILRFDFFSTEEQIINDLKYGIPWLFRSFFKGIKIAFKVK